MPSLPVVLIGCGAVARYFYAPALRALEKADELHVVALVDPSAPARDALAAVFPRAHQAPAPETLTIPPGALAIIASPPRWHAAQTTAAVARGWHVLCEKPIASSTAETTRMIDAAQAAGRLLAIGHYKRLFPACRMIKTLCKPGGPLGALRSFEIAEGGPFTWPAASPAFFQKSETPGGVLLDIGIHTLDLLLWWLGPPDHFDYADDAMGGLEANARLSLNFGSRSGRILLSRDWVTAQRYRFEFERGSVNWTVNDADALDIRFHDAPFAMHGHLHSVGGAPAPNHAQSFIGHLRAVADAVKHGTPVPISGLEAANALRLVENCYSRRQALPQPWLDPLEAAAARDLGAAS